MMNGSQLPDEAVCPGSSRLTDFSLGKLSLGELQAVSEHLVTCARCEALLPTLGPGDDSLVLNLKCQEPAWLYLEEPEFERMAEFAQSIDLKQSAAQSERAVLKRAAKDMEHALPPGTELGQYTIIERIGQGGMGAVYKALHRSLERTVALKLLRGQGTPDEQTLNRFQREMVAIGQLDSPYVVRATDAGQVDGVHYLVMELVAGTDVACVLRSQGRLRISDACEIARQTALGLHDIHVRRLVHRDIKPSNLMLDVHSRVKILDLGLAFLHHHPLSDAQQTYEGNTLGTPDYVAPEQVENTRGVDIRADIYSLGCTLYQLLAGVPPYSGPAYNTPMKKIVAHSRDVAPPLENFRPDVSPALCKLVARMMEKAPSDRFITPTELAAALKPFVEGTDLLKLAQLHPVEKTLTPAGDTSISQSGSALAETSRFPVERVPAAVIQSNPTSHVKPIPRRLWRRVFMGVGMLGVLALLAALMVKVQTPDGTLIVTVNEADAEVEVLNEEGKVEITRKGEKGPITIAVDPGKHRLKVSKDGFELFTQEFSIESGSKQPITAKLVPLELKPAVVRMKPLFFETPEFEPWAKEVAAMPAEQQVEAVSKKLMELNPGFDGKVEKKIEDGLVTELQFGTNNVIDISPVRVFVGLKTLTCSSNDLMIVAKLSDLSPLKNMRLTSLTCMATQVSDLSPLRGMQLSSLRIDGTKVTDLSPIKGMSLKVLSCGFTAVQDLTPLKGMPLTEFRSAVSPINDISPLHGMPLIHLQLNATQVSDLTPLMGMKLESLNIESTLESDLSPLKLIPLKELRCNFDPKRDTELLRSFKTLETINGKPVAEFWKDVEEQHAGTRPASVAGKKNLLFFETPEFEPWAMEVAAMTAEKQIEAVSEKLMKLNPGFEGKLSSTDYRSPPKIQNGRVTDIMIKTGAHFVADISPVRALTGLRGFRCVPLEPPWKGKLADLSPLQGLPLTNLYVYNTQVSDLSPLKGMPLNVLHAGDTFVTDLSPLRGMPLKNLSINSIKVTDLSPLKGLPLEQLNIQRLLPNDLSPLVEMPLKSLSMDNSPTWDTDLLRTIKTLETINGKPALDYYQWVESYQAEAKKPLAFEAPGFDQWIKQTAALTPEEQIKAVVKKLQDLNPGFDGKVRGADGSNIPKIEDEAVTEFGFLTDNVTDLSPVRAFGKLSYLNICSSLNDNRFISSSKLINLSPLKGLPLKHLDVNYTRVSELSPLQGMGLTTLWATGTFVADLSPLKDMPLRFLDIENTNVTDLSPLKGMPLERLECTGARITDFSPLKDLPLRVLALDFKPERDTELLGSIKTLETISRHPTSEFWKEVEE